MKRVYIGCMVIGVVLPYTILFRFYQQYGMDWGMLITLIQTNLSAQFLLADLFVSLCVFTVFMFHESKRLNMKRAPWIAFCSIFMVGLSLAIPLFLYLREKHIEKGDYYE